MNQPHRHPQGRQAAQGIQHLYQEQMRKNTELERQLKDLQDRYDMFFQVYKNPPQNRAGVIEYPDKRPFPYIYRQELLNGSTTFGTAALSAGAVKASFQFDSGRPVYLRRIQFGLIRTAHNSESATIPLNTYLPLSGMMPNGAKGLDFRWKASVSKGDLNLGDGWLDSSVFDLNGGYDMPVETPMYQDSILSLDVESWGAADSGNNEAFRLFCMLHCYKMRQS